MNIFNIILVILIIIVTVFFEYMLIIKKVYPWDIFTNTNSSNILQTIIQDILPKNKTCSLKGEIQDYNGKSIIDKTVDCALCIKYRSKNANGCTAMTYNSITNSCELTGDPKPC